MNSCVREPSLFPIAAATLTAFALAAVVFVAPDMAGAGDVTAAERRVLPAVPPGMRVDMTDHAGRPRSPDQTATERVALDETDRYAALESIQFALSEVGDGATYIWHRHNGRLSGTVHPTGSFRSSSGEVCRHVVVMLASGSRSRKTEGVACRLPSGQWRLEG